MDTENIHSDSEDFEIPQPNKINPAKSSFFDGLCQGVKLSEKQKKLREKVRQQSQMISNQTTLKQKIQKNKNSQRTQLDNNNQNSQNFGQQKVIVDGKNHKNNPVILSQHRFKSFEDLRIIRPLMKSISDNGYLKPTPIQQQAIPVIMTGKDVVASSITGSGKTAAFLLPIIQRYFHAAAVGYIRALIVTPTRQLAIQIHEQFQKLNKFTKLQACLVIGGSSIQRQEQILRNNPEVVISTPGRIIDLVMNSRSVGIQNLQMIVFDEADKLLDLGFEAQIKQIMSQTHSEVQTILFSATITKEITKLASITTKKPIRISADPDNKTAEKLHQQVIKLRQDTDQFRQAVLISVLMQLYHQKVIVFFKTKKQCHRIAIILGLLGMQSCQLHGNLSQTQRIQAFLDFKQGKYNYMLATDLAARGLDIKQVKTVVNFELPIQLTRYIHRIGRTARAGNVGTSLTLCNDYECLELKKMSKKTGDQLFKLNVKDESVKKMLGQIRSISSEVENVLAEQREQRQIRKAEMELKKVQNIQQYQDQIMNRPKREWFMSETQKKKIQDQTKKELGLEPLNNNLYEKNTRFSGNDKHHKNNSMGRGNKFQGKGKFQRKNKFQGKSDKFEGRDQKFQERGNKLEGINNKFNNDERGKRKERTVGSRNFKNKTKFINKGRK